MNPGPINQRGFLGGLGALGVLALIAVSPGCRIGGDGKSYLNENDELRRENLALEREVARFEKDLGLLEGELATLRKQQAGATPIEGAVKPAFSAVTLGRYSGPVDVNDDGKPDVLRLYVIPVDQADRIHTIAGTLKLKAVQLDADADPVILAEETYDPKALDAAYRSGFTGIHYRVQVPLPADASADLTHVTAVIEITETGTGVTHKLQQTFPLQP